MILTLRLFAILSVLVALPAIAKDPPTHQCTKDGAVIPMKKKECAPAGGKWEPIPGKAAAPKPANK